MKSDQKITFWLRFIAVCRIIFGAFSILFFYYAVRCILIGQDAAGDPEGVSLFQHGTFFLAFLWALPATGCAILAIGAKHFIAATSSSNEVSPG